MRNWVLYSRCENVRLLIKRMAVRWLFAAAPYAAETPADIRDAVERFNQKVANAPAALGIEFRVKAAKALHAGWPELSRELAFQSVARLRSGVGWRITSDVMGALASLDPDGAISVLPRMQVSYAWPVIDALGKIHRIEDARSVYRAALARGARITDAFSLLIQLHNEKSPEAGDVYRDMLSGFSFHALEPEDALWIDSQLTPLVREIAPAAAVEGTLRILEAASNPTYGETVAGDATGVFQVGSSLVSTINSRDTVLLLAGARLFALAPAEFEKRKSLFARWGASGPIVVQSILPGSGTRKRRPYLEPGEFRRRLQGCSAA